MTKYAELRAALDAATQGPWEASEHQCPERVGCCPLVGRPYSICGMDRKNIAAATSFGTAVYIAACHPEAIRSLLAERDEFFFALQEISHPEAVRGDATKIARAALAQEQGGSDAQD